MYVFAVSTANSSHSELVSLITNGHTHTHLPVSSFLQVAHHLFSRLISRHQYLGRQKQSWSFAIFLSPYRQIPERYITLSMAGLHPRSPHHFARQHTPRVHKSYDPPTSVTRLQSLRMQTNTGNSNALTAGTPWSTRTRLRALSRLVASA